MRGMVIDSSVAKRAVRVPPPGENIPAGFENQGPVFPHSNISVIFTAANLRKGRPIIRSPVPQCAGCVIPTRPKSSVSLDTKNPPISRTNLRPIRRRADLNRRRPVLCGVTAKLPRRITPPRPQCTVCFYRVRYESPARYAVPVSKCAYLHRRSVHGCVPVQVQSRCVNGAQTQRAVCVIPAHP